MPPALTSKQMFVTGIVSTVVGVVATLFGSTFAFSIGGSDQVALGVVLGLVGVLAQILLTLGIVLIAVSPLARMLEQPRKRPDQNTVLIHDSLKRRARRSKG